MPLFIFYLASLMIKAVFTWFLDYRYSEKKHIRITDSEISMFSFMHATDYAQWGVVLSGWIKLPQKKKCCFGTINQNGLSSSQKQAETWRISYRRLILSISLLTELLCTVICVSQTNTKRTIPFLLLWLKVTVKYVVHSKFTCRIWDK